MAEFTALTVTDLRRIATLLRSDARRREMRLQERRELLKLAEKLSVLVRDRQHRSAYMPHRAVTLTVGDGAI